LDTVDTSRKYVVAPEAEDQFAENELQLALVAALAVGADGFEPVVNET
jgi:hypothetical protein